MSAKKKQNNTEYRMALILIRESNQIFKKHKASVAIWTKKRQEGQ
jgi:hypothetical protein